MINFQVAKKLAGMSTACPSANSCVILKKFYLKTVGWSTYLNVKIKI